MTKIQVLINTAIAVARDLIMRTQERLPLIPTLN